MTKGKYIACSIMCGALCVASVETEASLHTQHQAQNIACVENHADLLLALNSVEHIVQQEANDGQVLVDFGYTSTYLNPKDGLRIYDDRIQYLREVSQTLGCQTGQYHAAGRG